MTNVEPISVCVTGAAGQIGYCLVYMIARGAAFGMKQPLVLHLFDQPSEQEALEGVAMELRDCTLPLLQDITATIDVIEAFRNVSVAFLVGASRRSEDMERSEFVAVNSKVFKDLGEAIDKYARKDIKVLVVGNPMNTNTFVCSHYAPTIPRENFAAMTRLDQNRAVAQISKKISVPVNAIRNVVVWGNHSATQYPDITNGYAMIDGKKTTLVETIDDDYYLESAFVESVQRRGTVIITARQLSPAMSVAKATCDQMHDWWFGTPRGRFVSMGVYSDGSYGAPKDVIFSFPVEIVNRKWKIVEGLNLSISAPGRIRVTGEELLNEKQEALAACEEDGFRSPSEETGFLKLRLRESQHET